MGRIGSGVRVSVSFQKCPPGSVLRCPTAAENVVMTKGVVFRVDLTSLRLRRNKLRITSSPSYKHFVVVLCEQRTTDAAVSTRLDACRRSSRLYFSDFATRTVDNTEDLYMQ